MPVKKEAPKTPLENQSDEINAIFDFILNDQKTENSLMEAVADQEHIKKLLIGYLKAYQDALLTELKVRGPSCSHPLNAARALEKLYEEYSTKNYHRFIHLAAEPDISPETRTALLGLLGTLALVTGILLVSLVSVVFLNLIVVPAICLLFLPCYYFDHEDIIHVRQTARDLYGFLNKKLPTPEPIGIPSEKNIAPTLGIVVN